MFGDSQANRIRLKGRGHEEWGRAADATQMRPSFLSVRTAQPSLQVKVGPSICGRFASIAEESLPLRKHLACYSQHPVEQPSSAGVGW